MTPREKELTAKIESLERETRRLFRFETALLQVRDVLAASLPPNRGVALRDVVADIISIVEEAGFPLPTNQMSPDDEMSVSPDANIVPFPPTVSIDARTLTGPVLAVTANTEP